MSAKVVAVVAASRRAACARGPQLAVGLVLLLAACSIDAVTFHAGGGDAGVEPIPAGQVRLTVARDGTASGTVTSSAGGIACGSSCSGTFDSGASVTLTASPDAGARFVRWSGGGCGTAATCTLTLTAATTVTATFDRIVHPVTLIVAGSGTGTVTSSAGGINCPGACSATLAQDTAVTFTAAAGGGSQFVGWSVTGGPVCMGTGSCAQIAVGPLTITATFALNQALEVSKIGNGGGTVVSSPAGIDCGADCSQAYPPGTRVTLTATPAALSTFVGWSGGGCTGTGTCTVTVNNATLVTAEFRLQRFTLTVTRTGTGAGVVSSAPAGIECGSDCSEVYDANTSVMLTASPMLGSQFTGWSGGGCTGGETCTVTMTAATAVTATFTAVNATLVVSLDGNGHGAVTSSPVGINCGADCREAYPINTVVTLSANPNADSSFAGWSGGCTGTGPCVVTVSDAIGVHATFVLKRYALSVDVQQPNGASGSVMSSPAGISCGADCSEVYDHGTVVTLTATPGVGSTFAGWSGGGCSGTGTCQVTMTQATTVTAVFALEIHRLSVSVIGNGLVTSSPAGISCGADCDELWAYGTVVTLVASPGGGSIFLGWSGGGCSGTAPCTVTLTADTAVTASFATAYTLSVNVFSEQSFGDTHVDSSDGNIQCDENGGGTCTAVYPQGTLVVLRATAGMSSRFGSWTGACAGQGSVCMLTINGNLTTVARMLCDGPCL